MHHIVSFLKNFESWKSTAQNWKYVELCKEGKYFSISKVCQLRIFWLPKLKSVHCAVAIKSLGLELAQFTHLKRHTRFDDFVMLVYEAKDQYFILLQCHFLYSKPGGHIIFCTGVKFKNCFNVVKNHTRFLLSYWFRKSIVWPTRQQY